MESSDQYSLTYPPNISCWRLPNPNIPWDPTEFEHNHCSITSDMVNFLNLTGQKFEGYLEAYCLHPPANDDCPFGFCSNPDIAGSLVRAANYITGFCLAILIFYSPNRVKEAFWSQALITYSLLLTCGVSLIKGQLTRFHTVVLVSIVCSPVNVYFTGYAIRSFWSTHRLDEVLGRKKHLQRALVLLSVAAWIAILVYAYLPQNYTNFSQDSCRGSSVIEAVFLGTPFVFAFFLAQTAKTSGLTPLGDVIFFFFLAPPTIVIFCWVALIIRERRNIWLPGTPFKPRFSTVWRTIVAKYPFLQFWSVVVIPTYYWIGTIELGILSEHDVSFTLTFGQVLALFAAVTPVFEVVQLVPDLWNWFVALPWVLWLRPGARRRPTAQVLDLGQIGYSSNDSIVQLKEMGTDLPQAAVIQGLDP